jgi:hypothetical protein
MRRTFLTLVALIVVLSSLPFAHAQFQRGPHLDRLARVLERLHPFAIPRLVSTFFGANQLEQTHVLLTRTKAPDIDIVFMEKL